MQSYIDKSDDYFAHARKEIVPLLPPGCPRVLELGCGSGATLAWLRQTNRASHTVGVEISAAAAAIAKRSVDEVYCLDFERDEIKMDDKQFDLVLCLDVLEHLVDPWTVLDRLVSQYLAVGGTLIVSVPNVRHYGVVLPLLLAGRWEYADAGILDRTHLRFFTRNSAIQLLTHSQLAAPSCIATGFDGFSRKGIFNALTLGFFREFVTYQYFLAAAKVSSLD